MVRMHLVKRKKGTQEYYYIQDSKREKGKVVNKEVYLGKSIPKNIEQIKKNLEKEKKRELYQKGESIKEHFQKEWKKLPESMKEKELEQIAVAFTYNTNAIEGSTITLEETREIIQEQIAPNKPLKEIKETEAHAKIFLNILKKEEQITRERLLEWHKKIFEQTKEDIAGKYRDYLVRVANYRAPDWQEVETLIEKLLENIKKEKENHLEHTARIHYRFEKIHPFGDGNGRLGRLLMNHMLWHKGYPMIIIEYKKRKSYYKALTKTEEDFVKYFIRRYLTAHKNRITS